VNNKIAIGLAFFALLVAGGSNVVVYGQINRLHDEANLRKNAARQTIVANCERQNVANTVIRNILVAGLVVTPDEAKKLSSTDLRDLKAIVAELHEGNGALTKAEHARLFQIAKEGLGFSKAQLKSIDSELVALVKLSPVDCKNTAAAKDLR
jgi:hypothetical protein